MKIISDYKDYYDVCLTMYQDDILWKRDTVKGEIKVDSFQFRIQHNSDFVGHSIGRIGCIHVCGIRYPFIEVVVDKALGKTIVCYDTVSYLSNSTTAKVGDVQRYRNSIIDKMFKTSNDEKTIQRFFDAISAVNDVALNTLTGEPIVVAYIKYDTLEYYTNPMLRGSVKQVDYDTTYRTSIAKYDIDLTSKFEFEKVLDPYTISQQLDMFISNKTNPEANIITISDSDKAKKYGHDGKYSFRKEPKQKR